MRYECVDCGHQEEDRWLICPNCGDPYNMADDGADELFAVWYAGPAREDGGPRHRLQILRRASADGTRPDAMINLSIREWGELVVTAVAPTECDHPSGPNHNLTCVLPSGHDGEHMGIRYWQD
jgi:hypothetical protein